MASARKLAKLAATPAYWRALAHGVAATAEHEPALAGRTFATIVDIGANKGQFAVFARRMWPSAFIWCFEPMPAAADKLAKVLTGSSRLSRMALGAAPGAANLHVASRTDSSSLLPLGVLQRETFNMSEVGVVEIPVERLDRLVRAEEIARPALMKIDVQGFELAALEGAEGVLAAFDAVYVECSYRTLYDGQALAPAVEAHLTARGFALVGAHNVAALPDGAPLQADLLFERRA